MKNKTWKIIRSRESEGCLHEHLHCEDCGSVLFRAHRMTEASKKEIIRLAKAIRESEQEEHKII